MGVLEDETSQIISCVSLKFWVPRKVHPRVSICSGLFSQAQILGWFASVYTTGAALISTTEGPAPGFLVGRDLNCRDSGDRSRNPGDVIEGMSTEATLGSLWRRGWLTGVDHLEVCLFYCHLEMPFGFGIRTASVIGILIGLVCWGLAAGLAGSSINTRRFLMAAEEKPLGFPWCFGAVCEPEPFPVPCHTLVFL